MDDLSSSDAQNNKKLFEGSFSLSYNNRPKSSSLFNLFLYYNRLEIKMEMLENFLIDFSDVSIIYINYIIMAQYNSSNDSIQMSLSPECKLMISKINFEMINNLCLYDVSKIGLNTFKATFFKSLLPINYTLPTDQMTLFVNTDIQINKEPWLKCKIHVIKHELVITFPFDLAFDLSTTNQLTLAYDKMSILINLPNYDIRIKLSDNGQVVFNSLEEATKIRVLSLKDELTILKLDELIKFITAYGLKSEGVFRICGTQQNIERLFCLVLDTQNNFKIDPDEFTVNDVTSFLKKCIQSHLTGALISDEVYENLKLASGIKDKENSKAALKEGLKMMPDTNYRILRHICELLFMIAEMTEFNRMDSESLSVSAAVSFVSRKLESLQHSTAILKAFIEHFLFIFDCTEEEQRRLKIVLEKIKNPSLFSVRRQFLVNSSLKPFISIAIDETKTKIDKEDSHVICSLCIDQYRTIKELSANLLKDSPSVDLWHFISIKKKWFKRLLYNKDEMDDSIINGWKYPDVIGPGRGDDVFIFREKNDDREKRVNGTVYRCNVRIENPKNEIVKLIVSISMPNFMECLDERTENLAHNFQLSDIKLYRIHNSGDCKLYIIHSDGMVFCWKFDNSTEYKEFLLYFDKFRSG